MIILLGIILKIQYKIYLILIVVFLFTSVHSAQERESEPKDSLNNLEIVPYQNSSITRDWRIFNYPFAAYTTDGFSSFSVFPLTQSTSNTLEQTLVASKEEMLEHFRLQQNFNVNKKFDVFAQYLGYAQFIGAVGLLGVHIYQWSNLKEMPSSQPQAKPFNKYGF